MTETEFLRRTTAVTSWFDPLNPYEGDAPLFKVEKENFGIGKRSKKLEKLHVLAISAKRYALFNLKSGLPVIRKAMAHGLGHLRPPYKQGASPANIPEPTFDLRKAKLDRWHFDLWHRIVLAAIEGHPSQVETSDIVGFNAPAVSRYSASTPRLRSWFRKFNSGKPYGKQVKPFGFMLAFTTSSSAVKAAIANGKLDAGILNDGLPAVVSIFDDDPKRALRSIFDRNTGNPVRRSILSTYREAIAGYHLHSESKFENGEFEDSGITERRHIEAISVEYIGKEANRWEEQLHLGEIPEAQIEYGVSADGRRRTIAALAEAARRFTQVALAEEAGISRQELAAIVEGYAVPRMRTLRALVRASAILIQSTETGMEPG